MNREALGRYIESLVSKRDYSSYVLGNFFLAASYQAEINQLVEAAKDKSECGFSRRVARIYQLQN